MAEPTIAEKAEQFREAGKQAFAGALEAIIQSNVSKGIAMTVGDVVSVLLATAYTTLAPIGVGMAEGMANAEDYVAPAFSRFAAAGVNDIFGTNISAGAFAQANGHGQRGGAGEALGNALINILRGDMRELSPTDAPAAKYVGAMAQIALEDWFKGWFFEVLSSLVPQLDIGKIESYGALGDKVSNVLGLGRISNRVLRPIVDAAVVTPLEWQVNKAYRPKLLSVSEVARQLARGRWTRDQAIEELARQGYSADRIELLLAAQEKFFSAGDVRTFVNRNHWTRDQGIAHLKEQGYSEGAALDALRLEGLRRFDELETQEANALVAAYADRRIDRAQFGGMLSEAVSIDSERALFTELAELRRSLNTKRVTLSQVEAMVKSGVLNVLDYREAARRDGYPEEDVIALELQLRWEMDKDKQITVHRAEAAAERETERAAKAAAAAVRKAQIEADRAAQRRGPIAKLERAAVRGLIPFSRVEEVYAHDYDPDTVALLIDLVEEDREAYLVQQRRAEDAGKRTAQRGLSVSELQAALMTNVLTIQEVQRRLLDSGLAAEDVDVLVDTMAAKKADQDAAEALRDQAHAAGAKRSIDLGRFEQLVRRGARTVTQYDEQLAALGFDDADRAAMVELLQLQIADDAAARARRDEAAATLAQRGLSLDQFERAVILGVKTLDDYRAFLLAQDFTADAQLALVALLSDRVDEADAARARRQADGDRMGRPELPLATVRRAARLGTISPNVYAARLASDGYSDDDIEIDLELLLVEIADVQAQRQRRDAAERDAQTRNLSLAQVEQAVRRGLASLDDYRARAATLGYGGQDLELLVSLLDDELTQAQEARDRRAEIEAELQARELSLSQLEEAVKKGFKTLDQFDAEIRALGYGADDAELLTALLVVDLEAAAAPSEE